MVPTPVPEFSDESLTLFSRAERAGTDARRLLDENDRWRDSVRVQLDYLFELGAEFRKTRRVSPP
jgi:hypothetical protein